MHTPYSSASLLTNCVEGSGRRLVGLRGHLVALVGEAQGAVGPLDGAGVDLARRVEAGRAGLTSRHRAQGIGQAHPCRVYQSCGGEEKR